MSNKESYSPVADADAEDELSAPIRTGRITPQHSLAEQASSSGKPTPYADLRQLAGLIRRPSTQKSSNNPNAMRKAKPTTTPPLLSLPTPRATQALQPISGNHSNPTTPHAVRALQHRRNTPGFDRRKSGRIQRETPRDILRNLSKALAHTTKKSSPLVEQVDQAPIEEGSEDELSLEQPTLTLPLGPEDDSFDAPPPRLSMSINELDQTARSIEVARRESARQRLSRGRGSLGDELNIDGLDRSVLDSSKVAQENGIVLPEDQDVDELSGHWEASDQAGDTEDLRNLLLQRRSVMRQAQQDADESLPLAEDDVLSPFRLEIPNFAPRPSTQGITTAGNTILEDTVLPDSSDGHHDEGPLQTDNTVGPVGDDGLMEEDPLQSERYSSPIIIQKPLQIKSATKPRQRKPLPESQFGIPYPAIPVSVTKHIANTFAHNSKKRKSRLGKATMAAIREAGDQFLTQLGGDLSMFARHAGRKNIVETDAAAAMMRQRLLTKKATAFSLAQHHLPGDLVRELRIPALKVLKRRRKCQLAIGRADPENDIDVL